MKKIVLTGGGTAGHIIPNIALFSALKDNGYEIFYIGRKEGIEKDLIEKYCIRYYSIRCGKLRRYLDYKNLTDSLNVIKGIKDALNILKIIKPDIIFSKGGFVAVPVVIAGKLCKIPIVIHESDITPGLANKISAPLAKIVCFSFPEALKFLPKEKSIFTGNPIRKELFEASKNIKANNIKFKRNKPIILIMGGSQGSVKINKFIRDLLDDILKKYNVIHICGKGNIETGLNSIDSYKQFEYIFDNIVEIYNIADIIVSRAGANSIYEFLAIKKPNLLIPLSKDVSRGDQILNSRFFEEQGYSRVLEEEFLSKDRFMKEIDILYNEKDKYINNMKKSKLLNGVDEIIKIILKFSK